MTEDKPMEVTTAMGGAAPLEPTAITELQVGPDISRSKRGGVKAADMSSG